EEERRKDPDEREGRGDEDLGESHALFRSERFSENHCARATLILSLPEHHQNLTVSSETFRGRCLIVQSTVTWMRAPWPVANVLPPRGVTAIVALPFARWASTPGCHFWANAFVLLSTEKATSVSALPKLV